MELLGKEGSARRADFYQKMDRGVGAAGTMGRRSTGSSLQDVCLTNHNGSAGVWKLTHALAANEQPSIRAVPPSEQFTHRVRACL